MEWEWWSNFMPWLILVQVKGAMDHPVYQVVVSVRLKVPWASHGRQFTKNSVTPPLLPGLTNRVCPSASSVEGGGHGVVYAIVGVGAVRAIGRRTK